MIDRLFGMRVGSREWLFRRFVGLPRALRRTAVRAITAAGRRQLRHLKTPTRLIFYVTNRCNARCQHCFFAAHLNTDRSEELHLDEIERVAVSFRHRIRSLLLTGGEPTLRDDLPAICRLFDRRNRTALFTIPSNGLDPDRIAAMMEEILNTTRAQVNAQVSLDGPPAVHDRLRGVPGGFDRALETARRLRALRAKYHNLNGVSVLTVISAANADAIEPLIDLVEREGGLFHKFQYLRSSATDVLGLPPTALADHAPPDAALRRPDDETLRRLTAVITRRLREPNNTLVSRRQVASMAHQWAAAVERRRTLRCLAGRLDGVLYANGAVALCEMTRPVANVRDFDCDFEALWHSPAADARRHEIHQCFCPHPCNISTSMSYDEETLLEIAGLRPLPWWDGPITSSRHHDG
jgi:MoaA/NifB/PqqE/SkfB family radical SAM enzyme